MLRCGGGSFSYVVSGQKKKGGGETDTSGTKKNDCLLCCAFSQVFAVYRTKRHPGRGVRVAGG